MSLSIVVCLLLATTSLTSSKPSQTREIKFQTQNPYTVSIGSRIFVISKNQTYIRIDSSDKSYSPCEIVVNAVDYKISGRIRATVLESQKIIVYGIHNESEKLLIKSVFHTILIVDPWHCQLKTLKSLVQDKVPLFFPVTPAEIVPRRNNQFDVFYLGPKECSPCRFDDEGRRIELRHQLKADRITPTDFHVRRFGKNGDYAYAISWQNGSSVLKVLNRDFTVINQLTMNNSLFDFSTSLVSKFFQTLHLLIYVIYTEFFNRQGTKKSFIGATFNSPDSIYEFYFTLLNSNLQPIFTNLLDKFDSDHIGLNAHFNVDSNGNSFVTFQQMSRETGESKVTFIRYDFSGKKIGNSFEFSKIPDDALYEMQSLLLEDHEYCLVLHKLDEPFGETRIKCIDVTKSVI